MVLLVLTAVVVAVVSAIVVRSQSRKRGRRKKPTIGGLAWALMFLSGGRMPPRPPGSQIEQEAGERKNRLIGRDGEEE